MVNLSTMGSTVLVCHADDRVSDAQLVCRHINNTTERLLPKPVQRHLEQSAAAHELFRQLVRQSACVYLIAELAEFTDDPHLPYVLGIFNGCKKDVHLVTRTPEQQWPAHVRSLVFRIIPWGSMTEAYSRKLPEKLQAGPSSSLSAWRRDLTRELKDGTAESHKGSVMLQSASSGN